MKNAEIRNTVNYFEKKQKSFPSYPTPKNKSQKHILIKLPNLPKLPN
jgi:hypothetical protein